MRRYVLEIDSDGGETQVPLPSYVVALHREADNMRGDLDRLKTLLQQVCHSLGCSTASSGSEILLAVANMRKEAQHTRDLKRLAKEIVG